MYRAGDTEPDRDRCIFMSPAGISFIFLFRSSVLNSGPIQSWLVLTSMNRDGVFWVLLHCPVSTIELVGRQATQVTGADVHLLESRSKACMSANWQRKWLRSGDRTPRLLSEEWAPRSTGRVHPALEWLRNWGPRIPRATPSLLWSVSYLCINEMLLD